MADAAAELAQGGLPKVLVKFLWPEAFMGPQPCAHCQGCAAIATALNRHCRLCIQLAQLMPGSHADIGQAEKGSSCCACRAEQAWLKGFQLHVSDASGGSMPVKHML